MTIEEFIQELKKIKINLNDVQINQLEKFYNILTEQNKVMNLTGIIAKEEVYLKHFYDSLTLNKVVQLSKYNSLCDIGSGAGFPGIVLKIVFPNLNITLIDSLNKRIKFLNSVIDTLKLKNIIAIHCRAEEFAKNNIEKFDIVTARAVAKTNILLEIAIPMVKINGVFIAMKANISDEIKNIQNSCNKLGCVLERTETFKLPVENSIRNLLYFKKEKQTNLNYPRKFEQIKKNPL